MIKEHAKFLKFFKYSDIVNKLHEDEELKLVEDDEINFESKNKELLEWYIDNKEKLDKLHLDLNKLLGEDSDKYVGSKFPQEYHDMLFEM